MIFVAEIGINANGDVALAKKLIKGAAAAGCDAVKFQKREINSVYAQEFLDGPRESQWGTTQREQKMGLEFGRQEYDEIEAYCEELGIGWFASAWDLQSLDFLGLYAVASMGCFYGNKIASPMLTNSRFVEECANKKFLASGTEKTFISTGMSNVQEISTAVSVFEKAFKKAHPKTDRGDWGPSVREYYELMHCISAYPTKAQDANLQMIGHLRNMFRVKVGFSDHSVGSNTLSIAAAALGATSLERHITLDRSMYGSDQKLSTQIGQELNDWVFQAREAEKACRRINPLRTVYECEQKARKSLV